MKFVGMFLRANAMYAVKAAGTVAERKEIWSRSSSRMSFDMQGKKRLASAATSRMLCLEAM